MEVRLLGSAWAWTDKIIAAIPMTKNIFNSFTSYSKNCRLKQPTPVFSTSCPLYCLTPSYRIPDKNVNCSGFLVDKVMGVC